VELDWFEWLILIACDFENFQDMDVIMLHVNVWLVRWFIFLIVKLCYFTCSYLCSYIGFICWFDEFWNTFQTIHSQMNWFVDELMNWWYSGWKQQGLVNCVKCGNGIREPIEECDSGKSKNSIFIILFDIHISFSLKICW
jgi:hypothetical protein